MKHVVRKYFKVTNFWYRFDWQSRGSGHVHGFIWLEDQPPPSTMTEKSREALASYWASIVSAINPDQSLPQLGVNPASLPFSEQKNTLRDLTECLNRFQRHQHCSPPYCLKKKKGTNLFHCRFHFPRKHRSEAVISREENPLHWKFLPSRNDTLLNNYISLLTLAWRANIDVSPCTNSRAVLQYIAKYASKSEKKSQTYHDMFAAVATHTSSLNPILSSTTKMMNALLVERDWPAQEAMHHLLGLPLVESSRIVVPINVRSPVQQNLLLEIQNGSFQKKREELVRKISWSNELHSWQGGEP